MAEAGETEKSANEEEKKEVKKEEKTEKEVDNKKDEVKKDTPLKVKKTFLQKGILPLIVIGILVLAGGGIIGFIVGKGSTSPVGASGNEGGYESEYISEAKEEVPPPPHTDKLPEQHSSGHETTSENTTSAEGSLNQFSDYEIEPLFRVNLLDKTGRIFLRVGITLKVDPVETRTELDTKKAILRDRIITVLSSKTQTEISSREGKEILKLDIIKGVNEFLTTGRVKDVYYTEFAHGPN